MSKLLRRHDVVEYINSMGSVSFNELKKHFPSVSEMTLRTDLKELSDSGSIIRTRGGAKSIKRNTQASDLYMFRLQRNVDKKEQIAVKAEAYLREQLNRSPNLTIYLGPGSTVTEIAKHFPDEWCTIITDSISCAYELMALKKPTVVINGGTLNRYNCSCDGVSSLKNMERVNFDIMFLSVAGYSEEAGFTCIKEIMDETLDIVKKNSKMVIVPIDSTKFGVTYSITHAKLEDVDIVITDDGIGDRLRSHFTSNGIVVL